MNRPLAKKIAVSLVLVSTLALGVLAACSNQGEGERCDVLNGNDDCKTSEDLVCYPANQLTNTKSDRCCPSDRTRATQPVCLTPINVEGVDAQAPADTGPPSDTTEAGGSDGATEDADASDDAADGAG